jgi:GntR family transcriptional regulator / MocR family aminotransferase
VQPDRGVGGPAADRGPDGMLDQRSSTPMYRQLYLRLRTQILCGQLEAGTLLPSTRSLAAELGVSRTTTALAYEQLLLEGYVESRVGHGTRVASLGKQRRPPGPGHPEAGDRVARPSRLARRGLLLLRTPFPEVSYVRQVAAVSNVFRVGEPDTRHFPYEAWARLVARHARRTLRSASYYRGESGYGPLREAIAAHIGVTRGVRCDPDQVILTTGAQGALDLAARVLLDPGDAAWMEDPGYGGARGALVAAGATPVAVPVDREGIDVEAGRARSPDARLAVVTPSHQFPTAVTMTLARRLALLEWAREARAWIVEDDYDTEYRFSGRPLEALQSLDDEERVVYVGTFSKVLMPSMRMGYVVVPPVLVASFRAARRFTDLHTAVLEQMAMADFFAEGQFARHVRRMRSLYLERRDVLVDALGRELGDILAIGVPEAGMHLVAWLDSRIEGRVASRAAAAQNLHVEPVSHFGSTRPVVDGLVLGFARATPGELEAGVRSLATALRSLPA